MSRSCNEIVAKGLTTSGLDLGQLAFMRDNRARVSSRHEIPRDLDWSCHRDTQCCRGTPPLPCTPVRCNFTFFFIMSSLKTLVSMMWLDGQDSTDTILVGLHFLEQGHPRSPDTSDARVTRRVSRQIFVPDR